MAGPAEEEPPEIIDDLLDVVRELRAHLEWQQVVGASGVPRDPRPATQFRANEPELPAPPAEETATMPRTTMAGPAMTSPAAPAPLTGDTELASQARRLAVLPHDLQELATLVSACTQCGLHAGRSQTVFARGTGASGLCFVGEGPGADEDAQGFPFVGAAGQLLDRMIQAMGFARDEVYVCNIVKCRPPNNRKPTDEEMSTCKPFLQRQLLSIQPKVIVALGATAVAGLLGDTRGISKIRGSFRLYDGRIAVMPTFHPAYLLRNPAAKREVWSDLRQVVEHMGRQLPKNT